MALSGEHYMWKYSISIQQHIAGEISEENNNNNDRRLDGRRK